MNAITLGEFRELTKDLPDTAELVAHTDGDETARLMVDDGRRRWLEELRPKPAGGGRADFARFLDGLLNGPTG